MCSKERFDSLFIENAELGKCDSIGGAEYRRKLEEWSDKHNRTDDESVMLEIITGDVFQ